MKKIINKEPNTPHLSGELVIRKFKDGKEIWRSKPLKNKVVSSTGYGRNLILNWMAGVTTYPIVINSMALGDDNTAPTDGDTGLGNSLVSGLSITDITVSNDEMTIDVFVADGSLADDTYEEVGFFVTGRLMSRIILSPAYTKASGEDTLFTYQLTFSG